MSIEKINEVMALTDDLAPCCASLACKMYANQLDLLESHRDALYHAERLFTAICADQEQFTKLVKRQYLDWLATNHD